MISERGVRLIPAIITAIVAGSLLGIITQFLQGELSANWGTVFANSGIAWSLAAFRIGSLMPSARLAALGGAVARVAAAIVYCEAAFWFEDIDSGVQGALMWSAAALIVGPPFGLGGHWARTRPDRRFLSWALVAGVLIGEGAHLIWFVGVDNLWSAGVAELTAGATIGAISLRTDQRRVLIATVMLGAAAATRIGPELLAKVF